MKRTFVLTLLNLILAITSQAQPACSVRTFSIRDGLPANAITTIKQDSNGLIWIATWNGLCCYDGTRFTTFRGDAWGSDNALSTNRIAAIMPDSKGNVWVRTYDAGLYLFETHQCRYINIGLMLQKKYGATIIPRNIYTLSSGHTWIVDENTVMNLRIDDSAPSDINKIEVIDAKTLQYGELIRKVEEDAKGHEWLVTDKGMIQYGTKEKRNGVQTLFPETTWKDSKGRSWEDAGTLFWTEDRQGTVWQVTNDKTLNYYDEDTRQLIVYTQLPNFEKYFVDQQKNVWLYSNYGLTRLNFHYQNIQRLTLEEGYQTRSILCRKDGSTWAGTINGYIGIYQNTKLTGWLSPQGKVSSSKVRFADRIYVMKEDSKGRTWIGTKGQGLYVISADGSTISHYMPDAANHYSINHSYVYDICEDEYGKIWIGTFGGGVNIVDERQSQLRFIHAGNELKRYPEGDFMKIRRITHDGRGTMLFSCTGGLVTCSNKVANSGGLRFFTTRHLQDDVHSLHTNDVMQTLITRQGVIYVTTLGGGIQRIKDTQLLKDNLQFDTVEALNEGEGNALSMIEDHQGNIWIARETELCCYQPKTDKLLQYGPNSTNGSIIMTEAQPVSDNSQHIWMGCVDGLITFKEGEIGKSNYQPHIMFTSVLYQGERSTHPILNSQWLTVQPNQRNLTINFAALDYDDNYLMRFAYKMGEKEDKWNYIDDPNISFSQLPPGRHTLVVKSTNCDGVWANNETILNINVVPTFWERGWVRLLMLLLVIGLTTWAVIAYLGYRKKSQEREKRLESIMHQYRQLQEEMDNRQQTVVAEVKDVQPQREYKLAEPEIVNPDEEMMNKLMAFIEQRLSDEQLKIEEMADAVGLGRTVFYSKIRELVGVSPSDFLRQIRMQRAEQLVAKSKMTFSEIAYSVGFTDPKYFTKCFKKQTGMTPSEYRDVEKWKG